MVRHIRFSQSRLLKFIDQIQDGEAVEFGVFLRLGGSKNQIVSFLKNCEKLEYEQNSRWRKIPCTTDYIVCSAES